MPHLAGGYLHPAFGVLAGHYRNIAEKIISEFFFYLKELSTVNYVWQKRCAIRIFVWHGARQPCRKMSRIFDCYHKISLPIFHAFVLMR